MSRPEPSPGYLAFRHTSTRAREAHRARAKRGARDERRARSFPAASASFAAMCDVVARKDATSTRRDEGIRAFATTTRMRAPRVFRGFASDTTAVRTWRDAKRFADAGQGARTTVLTPREGAREAAFIKADCDANECGTFEEACEAVFERGERVYARAECTTTLAVEANVGAVGEVFAEDVALRNCGVWFGAAGNVTPLHYDLCHGFLIMIRGVKTFTIFHKDDFRAMYQRRDRPELSRVNLDAWYAGDADERDRFPDFEDATPLTFTLYPGDMIYTPPFFWHHVRTHDGEPAISVLVPFDLDAEEPVHVSHLY